MKRFFCAVTLLALLCAVGLTACTNGQSGAQKRVENSISYYYTEADTSTRFICNNTLLEDKLGGEADAIMTCDGTVGIARIGTGLYRIDNDGVLMVHPAGVDRALLSLDGSKIVFTTATEVHVYDHVTDEREDIKPASVTKVLSIVISPDGGTVGYSVRSSDGNWYAYAHTNGESRKLANNAYLVGIADGGEFWYYLTPSAQLYYASDKGEKLIAEEVSNMLDFNRDMSEILFDTNGVTYMSIGGKSARRLISGVSVLTTAGAYFSTQGGDDCIARVRECDTLTGCVYYNYSSDNNEDNPRTLYNLWYVNSARKAVQLAKGAYQFGISEDGKTLTCLVDDTVYKMDINDPKTAKTVANNVYSYLSSRDARSCYCIGYDRILYYVADGAAPVSLLFQTWSSYKSSSGRN